MKPKGGHDFPTKKLIRVWPEKFHGRTVHRKLVERDGTNVVGWQEVITLERLGLMLAHFLFAQTNP